MHGIVRNIEHGSCVLACPEHNHANFGPWTSLWPYELNDRLNTVTLSAGLASTFMMTVVATAFRRKRLI